MLDSFNRVPKGLSIMMDGIEDPIEIDGNTGKFSLILNASSYNFHCNYSNHLSCFSNFFLPSVSAQGYENKSLTVTVKTNENLKVNIVMDSIGMAVNYHNYDELVSILTNFSKIYPEITSLYRYYNSFQAIVSKQLI